MDRDSLEYWGERFWEEADLEESFDIGEISMNYVPKLERKVESLAAQLAEAQADNAALIEALGLCQALSDFKVMPPSFYRDEWSEEVEAQYRADYKRYESILKNLSNPHPGAARLKELDQLRKVRDAAEEIFRQSTVFTTVIGNIRSVDAKLLDFLEQTLAQAKAGGEAK